MSRVPQATIERWFATALEVADPRQAVRNTLQFDGRALHCDGRSIEIEPAARLVVLAIGKAAQGMAQGARDVLGDRIDRGIILTKHGHLSEQVSLFDAFEAGHPIPDDNGLAATRAVLDAVSGLSAKDCVLALISGGGSALLESPRDGVSLGDMQHVTNRLMNAGAGIHDLNTVRKALSQVKGGMLRQRIGPARCVSLLLSDVLGNDPSVIASGPTVPSSSTVTHAQAVLERFGVSSAVSDSVRQALETEPGAGTVDTADDVVSIVANNSLFIREIGRLAERDGYRVQVNAEPYDGDAAHWGKTFVGVVRETEPDVDVLIRGGEATVEVRGDGEGGRNTEMALAAAIELRDDDGWVIASLASDGDDGNSGAAGAIADADTARRAGALGIDVGEALHQNDSAAVFRSAGGLVVTGPTGTNVNDVYIALRTATGARREDE